MTERTKVLEPIVIRGGRIVWAELLYVSGRGDYRAYLYRGKQYTVRTPREGTT